MSIDKPKPFAAPDLAVLVRKHQGRSTREGLKVVAAWGIACVSAGVLAGVAFSSNGWAIGMVAGCCLVIGASFVLYFFRDAQPYPSAERGAVLSPAHGTVDYIDTTSETHFLMSPARRISIYLSLLNVHVQHAPLSGRVEVLQHFPGRWSRASRRDSSLRNEHLLVGLTSEHGRPVAVRMISGIWVRRIVSWITCGQTVSQGERIGLIRFGSRVDVFLPLDAQINVMPGDRVRGGETILARLQQVRN